MLGNNANLQALTGGVRLKQRVQHPKVHERKDRGSYYWFFRYRRDELLPSGTIKTTRKFHTIGPSRGENAIAKKQAESKRDVFLAEQNAAPTRCEAAVVASQPVEVTAILFGKLAELWRKDYVDNPKVKLATPTREKYRTRLDNHILPRWKDTRLGEFRTKEILDWLQHECTSWHMMIDLRNIMSGIFTRAQEWEILPGTFANPMKRVKVGQEVDGAPGTHPRRRRNRRRVFPPRRSATSDLRDVPRHRDANLRGSRPATEALRPEEGHDPDRATPLPRRRGRAQDEEQQTDAGAGLVGGPVHGVDRREGYLEGRPIGSSFRRMTAAKPMWDSGVRKALKIAAADGRL